MMQNTGLGVLIKTRRLELNMSLAGVAKMIGVSRQYVSQIEHGEASLVDSDELVKKLANVLQLESETLKSLRRKRKGLKIKLTDPLCKFLYERRLQLSLSRKDLNRRLGHKEKSSLIHELESGSYYPSIKLLSRLEKVLDCKIPDKLILLRVPNDGSVLGRFLIARRLTLRLNQRQVADLARVSRSTVNIIERGIHQPKVRTLRKILKALKCDSGSHLPFVTFG